MMHRSRQASSAINSLCAVAISRYQHNETKQTGSRLLGISLIGRKHNNIDTLLQPTLQVKYSCDVGAYRSTWKTCAIFPMALILLRITSARASGKHTHVDLTYMCVNSLQTTIFKKKTELKTVCCHTMPLPLHV